MRRPHNDPIAYRICRLSELRHVFWGSGFLILSPMVIKTVLKNQLFPVFIVVLLMHASFYPMVSLADNLTGQMLASRPLPHLGQSCVSCHGAKGEGLAGRATPEIAGLDDRYIRHELDLFAKKKRPGVRTVHFKSICS